MKTQCATIVISDACLSRFPPARHLPQIEVDTTEDSESKSMREQHAKLLVQNEVRRSQLPVLAFTEIFPVYHAYPQDANREMGEINRRTAAVQRRHDGIPTPMSIASNDETENQSDKEILDEEIVDAEAKASDATEPNADTSIKNKSKQRVGVTVGNQELGCSKRCVQH